MKKNTSKYCFFRKLGLLFGLILTINAMHYCAAMEQPSNFSNDNSKQKDQKDQDIAINQSINTESNNKAQIDEKQCEVTQPAIQDKNKKESVLLLSFNMFAEKMCIMKSVLGKKISPLTFLDLDNEYTVIKKIGKGAYGCVLLCQHKKLLQQIAVKCATQQHKSHLALAKEARFLKKLSKYNGVIQYYNFYIQTTLTLWMAPEQTVCFLAIEYAPNGSLEWYALTHQNLDENFIRSIAKQIFAVLRQLHKKRIVYLDLKLTNIVLIEDKPKIIDFGMAEKLEKNSDTVNKNKFKTMKILECGYFPPEADQRCPYNKITHKADFWSFGYMIYSLFYLINRQKVPAFKIFQYSKEKMDIDVPFDGPIWNKNESQKMGAFIKSLMTCNPDERPSAEEIENNEWFKECSTT